MSNKIVMYSPLRHFNQKKILYTDKISEVLHHGLFINGPETKEIESKLANYVGVKHAIGVSSGTDALLIALMALGVGPGDEVITVPFTWISTAEVIKLLGATPIFCDVDKDTFNMDPGCLKKCITYKTKVVMPVSIFGQMYDVDGVNKVLNEFARKIYVIEDGAQSFGSVDSKGRKSCSVGDIGCTSFFPSKPLGCFGDGGMCFTNNDDLAAKMKMVKNHGCAKRYDYRCVGVNGRLDTLQAAVLIAKFYDFDKSLDKRISHALYYDKCFQDYPDIETPVLSKNCSKHVYAQYTIKLKDEKTRDALQAYLKERNIFCGVFYPVCLHLVDVITTDYSKGSLPVSEDLASRVLSLPVYPELSIGERKKVVETVKQFMDK